MQAEWFIWVSPRSTFKRLVLGTTLWRPKWVPSSRALRDWGFGVQKRAAEQSATHPVRTPNGSSNHQGITRKTQDQTFQWDHLQHVHLLLREHWGIPCTCSCGPMSHQPKGTQCAVQEAGQGLDKLAGTLENLQKPTGPKGATSKEDQVSCKVEIVHTQEMFKEAWKAHDKAIAKTYKLLRNLLSSHQQSQWDWVCCKMHKHDSWAEVNGQWPQEGIRVCGLLSETVSCYISS